MNKTEYLSKLNSCLSSLPQKERESIVRRYSNMFFDAGPENEQSLIYKIGSPQRLSKKILAEHESKKRRGKKRSFREYITKTHSPATIFIFIITFPIWGGLLVGMSIAILSLILGVIAAMLGCFAAGIVMLCIGISYLTKTTSLSLVTMGTGLACASFIVMIFTPAINLGILLLKQFLKLYMKAAKKILVMTEVNAR